jgi:ribosomal protein L44E
MIKQKMKKKVKLKLEITRCGKYLSKASLDQLQQFNLYTVPMSVAK